MGWWRRVNDVLKKEPETWLAYLYGQRFHDLKHLQDSEPRYKGTVIRVLIFLAKLLRRTRFRFSPRMLPVTYLVYAGTRNQLSALESTVKGLHDKGQSVVVVVPNSLSDSKLEADIDLRVMYLGAFDLLRVFVLATTRLLTVVRSVREISPALLQKRLDVFLQPSIDLIYFDQLLTNLRPQYVIVSNDHSIPNRTLLALARNRGSATIYMQHASVSSFFPALNVRYAFLDGMAAYEIYLKCESNHPTSDTRLETRQVILSGQKKTLSRLKYSGKNPVVGLAVNVLDSVESIGDFVKHMTEHGVKLKVRYHPGLGEKNTEEMRKVLSPYYVEFSDPRVESVDAFLHSVVALVASNSSIHLEAALCGIPAFYFELSAVHQSDYYGYVKHGVAIQAHDIQALLGLIDAAFRGASQVNADAVRYFSSTFETEWEGREGEFVADILLALKAGEDLSGDFVYKMKHQ